MSNTKFFEVSVLEKDGNPLFGEFIEANDQEEARKLFLSNNYDPIDDCEICISEVPIDRMIEMETKELHSRLLSKYVERFNKNMSVREFASYLKNEKGEEQKRGLYLSLSKHVKAIRITEYLESRLDTSKITHAEFCKIRDALCKAKSEDEIEKINREAVAKYERK